MHVFSNRNRACIRYSPVIQLQIIQSCLILLSDTQPRRPKLIIIQRDLIPHLPLCIPLILGSTFLIDPVLVMLLLVLLIIFLLTLQRVDQCRRSPTGGYCCLIFLYLKSAVILLIVQSRSNRLTPPSVK